LIKLAVGFWIAWAKC